PEPVLFETAGPLLVTPARLMDTLSVSPKRDRIVRLAKEPEEGESMQPVRIGPGPDGRGVALFGPEGTNLQEHVFYLKHDELFLLESPSFIEIAVKNTSNAYIVPETVQHLTDRDGVVWEYYSGG